MRKRLFGRLVMLAALLCALTVFAPTTPARRVDCSQVEPCRECVCHCLNARHACLGSGTHWTICHAEYLECTEACGEICPEG